MINQKIRSVCMKHKPKRFLQTIFFISLTGTILQSVPMILAQTLITMCRTWACDSALAQQWRNNIHAMISVFVCLFVAYFFLSLCGQDGGGISLGHFLIIKENDFSCTEVIKHTRALNYLSALKIIFFDITRSCIFFYNQLHS